MSAQSASTRRVTPVDGDLRGLSRRLWISLPALVVSGSIVSAVAAPMVILGAGIGPLSLLWLGLVVAPLYGGLLVQALEVVTGAEPSVFGFGRCLRRGWRAGLLAGAVPAIAASVFVISRRWWASTHDPVALASLTSSGLVSTLGLLCAVVAPAIFHQMPTLRGWPLVIFALHVVARRPAPALGVLATVVIIVGAAVQWSASVLVLLPVPLALVSVLAARRTAAVSAQWRATTAQDQ